MLPLGMHTQTRSLGASFVGFGRIFLESIVGFEEFHFADGGQFHGTDYGGD